MKAGYLITNVMCETCRMAWTANAMLFLATTEEVEKLAEKIHIDSKLICGSPRLIVGFTNALISDVLAEPANNDQRAAANGQLIH